MDSWCTGPASIITKNVYNAKNQVVTTQEGTVLDFRSDVGPPPNSGGDTRATRVASALTLPARLPQRAPARPRLPARGPATASRGDAAVESSQTPHNPPDTCKRALLSPPRAPPQKCCARRPMRTLPPWPSLVLPARHRLPKAAICIASRGGAAVEPLHAPQPAPSSSKATSKSAAQKVL